LSLEQIGWRIVASEGDPDSPAQPILAYSSGLQEVLSVELIVPGTGKHPLSAAFFSSPFDDEFGPFDKLDAQLRSAIIESVRTVRGG
jgi:hypothetical protein